MIMLGIPTRGVVFTQTIAAALSNLKGVDHVIEMTMVEPVHEARNELVERFLSSKATHLWTLDDDEIPPDGILQDMLREDVPIVVVDAPGKRTGKSNIFRNRDGSIAATGFGCALFAREVFETIPAPWFDLAPWRRLDRRNGRYEFPIVNENPNPWGGEDVNFSIKLKGHGYDIISLDDVCTHLEYTPFLSDNRAIKILEITEYREIIRPAA